MAPQHTYHLQPDSDRCDSVDRYGSSIAGDFCRESVRVGRVVDDRRSASVTLKAGENLGSEDRASVFVPIPVIAALGEPTVGVTEEVKTYYY
jgi:hypothetical protein